MAESSEIVHGRKGQIDSILDDLTASMMEVLTISQKPIPNNDSSMAHIGVKLDDTNYVMWSQIIKIYILGKGKLLIKKFLNLHRQSLHINSDGLKIRF